MLELDAIDSDRRQSTEDITMKALGHGADANALKSVMAELRTRKLIDSKTGRGGGCWLTENGRARAEKLRDLQRNSATV
jgi:DNA-binding IscR family transcriptional regulator